MTKISAIIIAHNEEVKIEDCLRSLDFVDEIVVVLDKCTDQTKEIVLKYTNKIAEGSWSIEGERRNVGLDIAKGEWLLEIDADERISSELKHEIIDATKKYRGRAVSFYTPIDNYIGRRLVKYGWLRTMGVLRRQSLCSAIGLKKYHEDKEIHPTFDFQGEILSLKNPIIHLMDDNISDLINRFNRYTNWKANDMLASSKIKGGWLSMIYGMKFRFIKSLLLKKGYKEGLLGLLIALLCALYPLVSYLKSKEKNENR